MNYLNDYLGVSIELDDSWVNVSPQLANVNKGLKELYQTHNADISDDPDMYKYLVTADKMSHSGKQRKTSVLLCVHEVQRSEMAYKRLMGSKLIPDGNSVRDTLLQGECIHGDFKFDYVDQIGMSSSTHHAWTRLFDNIWLYAHVVDYTDLLERPAIKWLNKLKAVPRTSALIQK